MNAERIVVTMYQQGKSSQEILLASGYKSRQTIRNIVIKNNIQNKNTKTSELPTEKIVNEWVNNINATSDSLAVKYKCSNTTISSILKKEIELSKFVEIKQNKMSYSSKNHRQTVPKELRIERAKHASSFVTEKGKNIFQEARKRGIKNSAEKRKGKPLPPTHIENLSLSHLGINKCEKHPNWKGGTSKICWRGTGWARARRECRKRDNYICQLCHITPEKQGRQMDVHHIKSFFDFADAKEANQLSNLISLCRSCHRKVENKRISILRQAELAGIPVILVNPKNTSRECFACGHIAKENRKSQSEFECVNCNHKNNADINAAKIISRRASVNNAQSSENIALICAV